MFQLKPLGGDLMLKSGISRSIYDPKFTMEVFGTEKVML